MLCWGTNIQTTDLLDSKASSRLHFSNLGTEAGRTQNKMKPIEKFSRLFYINNNFKYFHLQTLLGYLSIRQ